MNKGFESSKPKRKPNWWRLPWFQERIQSHLRMYRGSYLGKQDPRWRLRRQWRVAVAAGDLSTAIHIHEILKLRNAMVRKEKRIRELELNHAKFEAKAQVFRDISGKPNLTHKVNHLYANLGPLLDKTLDELSMEELSEVRRYL